MMIYDMIWNDMIWYEMIKQKLAHQNCIKQTDGKDARRSQKEQRIPPDISSYKKLWILSRSFLSVGKQEISLIFSISILKHYTFPSSLNISPLNGRPFFCYTLFRESLSHFPQEGIEQASIHIKIQMLDRDRCIGLTRVWYMNSHFGIYFINVFLDIPLHLGKGKFGASHNIVSSSAFLFWTKKAGN